MKKLELVVLFILSLSIQGMSVEEGKKALMPFKKNLMGTLMSHMKSEGPEGALKACHLEAMPITQKHAKKFVAMGRTSHKLRNPENKPQEWVKPYLEEFKEGERKEAMVVQLKNGNTGYLEPIYVKAQCLVCHGEKVSAPVEKALEKDYPADQARGFKAGDFRGLFWFEVAK